MENSDKKQEMRKAMLAFFLFMVALAMYVSIIYKIKTYGP